MKFAFLLLPALLLLPPAVSSQDQAPAPTFSEGDYWQFHVSEDIANVASTRELDGLYQVSFSQGKLQLGAPGDGQSGKANEPQTDGSLSRQLSMLFGLDETQQDLKFPISVGQRWKYSFQFKSMGEREYITRHVEIQVVGIEPISTAAGSFRAFKLIKEAIWSTGGKTPRQNQSTTTYYYSPESRSVVKSSIVSSNGTTRDIELVNLGSAAK